MQMAAPKCYFTIFIGKTPNMKHIFCLIACSFLLVYNTKAQNISYKYQQNRSFTVDEVTEAYSLLQKKYPKL
jgi:hypothetical protein